MEDPATGGEEPVLVALNKPNIGIFDFEAGTGELNSIQHLDLCDCDGPGKNGLAAFCGSGPTGQ